MAIKIKLITRMAGPEGIFPAGSIIERAEKEANMLIRLGYAVGLDVEKPIEHKAPIEKPKKKVNK